MRPALQQLRVGGCCGLIEENVRCSDTHARRLGARARGYTRACGCVRACTCASSRALCVSMAHPRWYPERHGCPSCMVSNMARYLSAEQYPSLHGRRTNLFGEERERDVREQHGQEREAQLRMYAVLWALTWYSG